MSVVKEIKDTLNSKESVWVLLLADSLHEDGKVMMVVKLANIDLPLDFVGRSVLNLDGEISTVVEAAELRDGNGSAVVGTSSGLDDSRLGLGSVEGADLATVTLSSSDEVCRKKKRS